MPILFLHSFSCRRLGVAPAVLWLVVCGACWRPCIAEDTDPRQEPAARLTDLSVEELLETEITSVSRKQEPLFEAAAAVTVITQEDLRRSGVTSIPEALRLVPGLQVARTNSNQWAITARGFNNQFANKLLVLVDGRSVYTPLFAGVYWDIQDVLLEHIARIEVIRGPGATLWGANAVNGVINVITKKAADTPGWFASAGGGTEERTFVAISLGGGDGDVRFRAFGKAFDRDGFVDAQGVPAADDWLMGRGGLRLDWTPSQTDLFTLQGDLYVGDMGQTATLSSPDPPYSTTTDARAHASGGDLLARWNRAVSPRSRIAAQAYWDLSQRHDPFLGQTRNTLDFDFQADHSLGDRQQVIWGLGYRFTTDDIDPTFVLSLNPLRRGDHFLSAFIQDELVLRPRRLRLTLGSKFEHNSYTGFEVQPSARLIWTPDSRQTFWGAVSRAVRTPSRVEDDVRFVLGVLPSAGTLSYVTLLGNRSLESDELLAYELGYRVRPTSRLWFDAASFYNVYERLGTFEPQSPYSEPTPAPPHVLLPLMLENLGSGESYGVELAGTWRVTERWTLAASATGFQLQLHRDLGSQDRNVESAEGNDPKLQFQLRSQLDLPWRTGLDAMLYHVGELPGQSIPEYTRIDLHLDWHATSRLRLSVVGQNLSDPRHPEFGTSATSARSTEVPRSLYVSASWRH